jgi:hypothetical protein
MFRLPAHRFRPVEPEPAEVLQIAGLDLGTAARDVDILDAEQEAASLPRRRFRGEERRIGMPQMQVAGRRGREAGDGAGRFGGWRDRRQG